MPIFFPVVGHAEDEFCVQGEDLWVAAVGDSCCILVHGHRDSEDSPHVNSLDTHLLAQGKNLGSATAKQPIPPEVLKPARTVHNNARHGSSELSRPAQQPEQLVRMTEALGSGSEPSGRMLHPGEPVLAHSQLPTDPARLSLDAQHGPNPASLPLPGLKSASLDSLCDDTADEHQPQFVPLTGLHRAGEACERERLLAAGARVHPKRLPGGIEVGEPRVWLPDRDTPGLLLSRALGDELATTVGCVASPEVMHVRLHPGQDAYLVMASDGVWDVLTAQQVGCLSPDLAMISWPGCQ